MNFKFIAAGVALGALASIGQPRVSPPAKRRDVQAIEAGGIWARGAPAEEKARDVYRHPVDALAFWGLKPGMTILEIQPGGGWWTNILAPYARATKSEFYATAPNVSDPDASEGARKARDGLRRQVLRRRRSTAR